MATMQPQTWADLIQSHQTLSKEVNNYFNNKKKSHKARNQIFLSLNIWNKPNSE